MEIKKLVLEESNEPSKLSRELFNNSQET